MAHNHQIRSRLVSRILASNYRLFEDETAVEEWDKFLSSVVAPPSAAAAAVMTRHHSVRPSHPENVTVALHEDGHPSINGAADTCLSDDYNNNDSLLLSSSSPSLSAI